jgi:hypothetical protein
LWPPNGGARPFQPTQRKPNTPIDRCAFQKVCQSITHVSDNTTIVASQCRTRSPLAMNALRDKAKAAAGVIAAKASAAKEAAVEKAKKEAVRYLVPRVLLVGERTDVRPMHKH